VPVGEPIQLAYEFIQNCGPAILSVAMKPANGLPMRNTSIKAAWIPLQFRLFVAFLLTFALLNAYAGESDSDQDSKTEDLAKESQNGATQGELR
jgi:hypothetical protein